jgi:flagellar protein FliS
MPYAPVRGADAYRQTQVQSSTPLELVVMLYDGALTALRQTIDAMERGDLVTKRETLGRALSILGHLRSTLNLEDGGSIAVSLDELYRYMNERITAANIHRDTAPLTEVVQLLSGLREAWAQIAQTPTSAA